MRRVHVIASGRVQGVFFRASTRDEAVRQGVTGWVRNTAQGTVEGEFQGSTDAVEAMLDFCRRGPGHATVSDLRVTELDPDPALTTFRVVH